MEILQLKNTITETKNSAGQYESRLNTAENTVSELEDRSVENYQAKSERKIKNSEKNTKDI